MSQQAMSQQAMSQQELPDIGSLSLGKRPRNLHENPNHQVPKRAFKVYRRTSTWRALDTQFRLFNSQGFSFEIQLRRKDEYCNLLATPAEKPYMIFELNQQQHLDTVYFYLVGRLHLIATSF